MFAPGDWKDRYQQELAQAASARENGNEGMARVCARRAASIILEEYLSRRGLKHSGTSIYDHLSVFNSLTDIDNHCREVANRFIMRVNPDHNLPVETDLINDVERLVSYLLLEKNN